MADNSLIPLEDAAVYLALQQWSDDTPRETALAALKNLRAAPGCYTPVYAVRILTEHRLQRQIDSLVKARKVALFDPVSLTPTFTAANALVDQYTLRNLVVPSEHSQVDAEAEEARAGEISARWSALADFEQQLIDLQEAGAQTPLHIRHWFKHDTWTVHEAMLLLLGLDPINDLLLSQAEHIDNNVDRIVSARYLSGALVDLDGWRNANVVKDVLSREPDHTFYDVPVTSLLLLHLSNERHMMLRVWRSGDHPDRNAPTYYIDWALSKGYEIPWLTWAREAGLLGDNIELAATARASNDATPSAPTPAPLRTPVVAAAFSGLNGWDEKEWARTLGDGRTQWLTRARMSQGNRHSSDPSTWDPTIIATQLADKGVPLTKLDAVFKKQSMKEWRSKWEDDAEFLRG